MFTTPPVDIHHDALLHRRMPQHLTKRRPFTSTAYEDPFRIPMRGERGMHQRFVIDAYVVFGSIASTPSVMSNDPNGTVRTTSTS